MQRIKNAINEYACTYKQAQKSITIFYMNQHSTKSKDTPIEQLISLNIPWFLSDQMATSILKLEAPYLSSTPSSASVLFESSQLLVSQMSSTAKDCIEYDGSPIRAHTSTKEIVEVPTSPSSVPTPAPVPSSSSSSSSSSSVPKSCNDDLNWFEDVSNSQRIIETSSRSEVNRRTNSKDTTRNECKIDINLAQHKATEFLLNEGYGKKEIETAEVEERDICDVERKMRCREDVTETPSRKRMKKVHSGVDLRGSSPDHQEHLVNANLLISVHQNGDQEIGDDINTIPIISLKGTVDANGWITNASVLPKSGGLEDNHVKREEDYPCAIVLECPIRMNFDEYLSTASAQKLTSTSFISADKRRFKKNFVKMASKEG